MVLLAGMVATLSALVLGLMISSAKTSFDSDRASVVEIAADILVIDRALAHYGDRQSLHVTLCADSWSARSKA